MLSLWKGVAMPINNGIVTAPVNTQDVARALAVNSNDVGTLCSSEKINPFAKYKATRYETLIPNPNVWKSKSGNCGILIPKITDYTKEPNKWIYEFPRGGIEEPFRLTDFEKYNHNSTPFLSAFIPNVIYNGSIISIHKELNQYGRRDDMINIEDIQLLVDVDTYYPLSEMYFAVILNNASNNIFLTSDNKIGGNLITDEVLQLDGMAPDTWYTITACLSMERQTIPTPFVPGMLWSLSYDLAGFKSISQKRLQAQATLFPPLISIEFYNPQFDGNYYKFDGIKCNFRRVSGDDSEYSFSFNRLYLEGEIIEDMGYINLGSFSGVLAKGASSAIATMDDPRDNEIMVYNVNDYIRYSVYFKRSGGAQEELVTSGQLYLSSTN